MWTILIITLLVVLQRDGLGYTGEYGGSMMEEKLETQIDPRPPRSFKYWDNLITRQVGFNRLYYVDGAGHKVSQPINNWETYTLRYWYENRVRNAECPMEPIGIAAATDWSLLPTCLFADTKKLPRSIFVHTYMLSHFYESTLQFMNKSARFILYSGGTDLTIPLSSGDKRYTAIRWFGDHGQGWESMIKDDRIVHWYAENHDINHPKVSTLPTGFTKEDYYLPLPTGVSYLDEEKVMDLDKRPLTVLHADRVRDGKGQWELRKQVEDMCNKIEWCIQPVEELEKEDKEKQKKDGLMVDNSGEQVTHEKFLKFLRNSPFIACVHGGGIDPSPKAFEAIYHGTIPIVKRSVLYDSYSKFPVAWVKNWEDLFEASEEKRREMMEGWIHQLKPYYEKGSALRKQALDRLKTAYWIEEGHKRLEKGMMDDSDLREERRRGPLPSITNIGKGRLRDLSSTSSGGGNASEAISSAHYHGRYLRREGR